MTAYGAIGDGVADDTQALRDALTAAPTDGIIDLEGLVLSVTSVVNVTKRVQITNGSIVATNHRCLHVSGVGATLRDVSFSRSADGGTSIERAIVTVQAEDFTSIDCDYNGVATAGLLLRAGDCDGARVTGGTCSTALRVQDAAGIAVVAGAANNDIIIDGVTVTAGVHGIALWDCSDSIVRNCTVSGSRKLPQTTLTGWTETATDLWRCIDRTDGVTRVLRRNGVRKAETTLAGITDDRWAIDGGYVYLSTATDPNGSTVTSDIVSGYGIMVYRSNVDIHRNLIANNDVSDCDGFGVYLQMGSATSSDNATDSNVIDLTCLTGEQTDSLGWGGIGVTAGTGTTISGDTITNTGVSGQVVCGFRQIVGGGSPTSDGVVDGVTVDTVIGHGLRFDATTWTYTNCTVNGQTGTAIIGGTAA